MRESFLSFTSSNLFPLFQNMLCHNFHMVSELFNWRALLRTLPVIPRYKHYFDSPMASPNLSSLEDSLNPHSPYYVHPSENPSTSLVSPLPDPTNYNSWCISMSIALSEKNKLEFIDGSLLQTAPNHALHIAWKRSNNMVVSWLIHSVSPSIRQSILWLDNAVDIWRDLKSRYSQGDLLRISELQ